MEKVDPNPSKLCQEFARILGSTPSVVNGVCTATRSRTNLHPVVLGRPAESFMFVPQAFSFENMNKSGKALCLGETVLLQEEVNPFMSKLRKHGIIVTATHNHWLFDKPRLMYMHFESVEEPLTFARKVRDAMRVLTTKQIKVESSSYKVEADASEFSSHEMESKDDHDMQVQMDGPSDSSLCDQFSRILKGEMHTFEDGICLVMRSRHNIQPVVLGRQGRSFLLIPQMFTFESMSADGRALCAGETVILQEELNPFISKLRKQGIFVTAFHNHWLFEHPRLMYIHWLAIDHPLDFARKTRKALSVLTNRPVRFRTRTAKRRK
ncbi:DUF1259 domain-containing protein [Lederbergia galactosidilytica]|uniref:DUF1259 domain-containing protein n=1 Tax=Lederbergia galactosidilytica TaxID=217031 RepID=A0A178A5N0_9BACI|nr:DUF1259 domain-containing protein [Lederbergia galactosidilytica]OAK75497.1 hypothetical protein ABB05_01975 [Lederbergia galactosidilytica]